MREFEIPTNFASLQDATSEESNDENAFRIENDCEFNVDAANEKVECVCFELMENEPSRVLEQNVFEDVYHL